jgi:predicted RNase H-like HicB family nuclease
MWSEFRPTKGTGAAPFTKTTGKRQPRAKLAGRDRQAAGAARAPTGLCSYWGARALRPVPSWTNPGYQVDNVPMRTFTLEYWIDDGWYVGRLKEVPGVFSQGESFDELKENIRDAYRMMMEEESAPTGTPVRTAEIEV